MTTFIIFLTRNQLVTDVYVCVCICIYLSIFYHTLGNNHSFGCNYKRVIFQNKDNVIAKNDKWLKKEPSFKTICDYFKK